MTEPEQIDAKPGDYFMCVESTLQSKVSSRWLLLRAVEVEDGQIRTGEPVSQMEGAPYPILVPVAYRQRWVISRPLPRDFFDRDRTPLDWRWTNANYATPWWKTLEEAATDLRRYFKAVN